MIVQKLDTGLNNKGMNKLIYLGLAFYLIFLISCQTDGHRTSCVVKNGYSVCRDSNSKYIVFVDTNNTLIKVRDTINNIDVSFLNGNPNNIYQITHFNSQGNVDKQCEYNINGEIAKITYYDNSEDIFLVEEHIGHKIRYKLYNFIGDTVNRPVVTSYYDVNATTFDTSNYFLFNYKNHTLEILTDVIDFKFDSNLMDSTVIEYTSDIDCVQYYSPEPHLYLPDLSNCLNRSSVRNRLKFEVDNEKIIGSIWSFSKNKDFLYSYQLIVYNGSSLKIIEELINKYEYFDITELAELTNSKFFVKKGDNLEFVFSGRVR